MENKVGYIYILTNPSFKEYVKIGYADDVQKRVDILNSKECTPFAFRIYATYKVNGRLKDLNVHTLIDSLRPDLRSVDNVDGKIRKREFYAMSPEDAYTLLETIAAINGLQNNLVKFSKSKEESEDEQIQVKIETLAKNRHHFKEIEFFSSLTNKTYIGKTNDEGTLSIYEKDSGIEIVNNANPSKKAIMGQAIIDLGGTTSDNDTSYQRYHKLMKMIRG